MCGYVRSMPLNVQLEPICVETVQGRKEYQQHQLDLCSRAQPIRRALLAIYDHLLINSWPVMEGGVSQVA